MPQDPIGIPACFSSMDQKPEDSATITRSGQSLFISVYKTELAGNCRLITVTWCKNLLLHGLSVSVDGHHTFKVELKPWWFWKKQGSKSFAVDGKPVDVFWDLKTAKFHGETEPTSDYYVAVVHDQEVVLLLGDLKKVAFRKTGCRPSLIDPILVSRKEHVFGKKKFATRVKFDEKGRFHEVSIRNSGNGAEDPEMEIRIDGDLMVHVKHLHWKFRGNECVRFDKVKIEVYWDVHDWLFSRHGLRHALFIIKPVTVQAKSPAATLPSVSCGSADQGFDPSGSCEFCLFLYAWKVE